MESTERDAAAVRIPPPLVYLTAILAGVLLQRYALTLPLGLSDTLRITAGAGATLFGFGLLVVAAALFRRTGQDPKPWTSTPAIISTGAYRLSRNPIYLGMALIQAAVGLLAANGWILLSLPLVLMAIQVTAIRHEEAYLERKFGDAYLRYKDSVRRWL